MRLSALALTATLAALPRIPSQAERPDARTPARVTVSGVVRVSDGSAVPPETTVLLADESRSVRMQTTPDVEGRFILASVPNGRYSLRVLHPRFLGVPHGASYWAGLEVLVAVAGKDVGDLELELVKPASISGIVRDRFGLPVASTAVLARRWGYSHGLRVLLPVTETSSATTDSQGNFKVEGLPGGEYVLSVEPVSRLTQAGARDLYVRTYHPGQTDPLKAVEVRLRSGDEFRGADIALSLVSAGDIAGRVLSTAGVVVHRLRVWARPRLQPALQEGLEGMVTGDAFAIRSVPDGEYVVEARAALGPPETGPRNWTHWARADIVVAGTDVTDIQLVLEPTVVVRGALQFDKPSGQPIQATVQLTVADQVFLRDVPTGQTEPDGSFTIQGVTPGPYRLISSLPSAWRIRSITDESGHRIIEPIQIGPSGMPRTLVVSYTSRVVELRGTVWDDSGLATSQFAVIVFPNDSTVWGNSASHVRAVRPDNRGQFVIAGLSEGLYLLAVYEDKDGQEMMDPAFLAGLVPGAIKIRLPDQGVVTRDVFLRR